MLLYHLLRLLFRAIVFVVGRAEFSGQENVPENGPYIIVTNHMSKADPPLVLLALPIPPLRPLVFAGEKWARHFLYGPILARAGAVFINRGEVDRKALKEAIKALQDGQVFGLAPEGTRSRVGALIKAKNGAAYLASRTQTPLLPITVTGTDRLGANLLHLRRTTMTVTVGKPFFLPDLGRRPKTGELDALTHYIMVRLAAQLPPKYRGYYAGSPALAALQRGEEPWPYCLEAEGVKAGQ